LVLRARLRGGTAMPLRRTPQEQGRAYEAELAARYGGRAQPGSGAGPRFKLDWKQGELLASVKHTTHESYRLTAADLRELLAGSQGPAGRGERGIMVIGMAGFPDDVFVVPGDVMRALLEGEVEVRLEPTKRAAKLRAAG
jgi:hypothetical protein